MSETREFADDYVKSNERPMLARTFETVELAADGRNLEMLCAPYDTPTEVADPPDFTPYEEEFARGAFVGATKAPNRVYLEFEHWHPGLSGILGHGAHFEERDDALYGRFRVTDHSDGDKALSLIREGVLTAASVFFSPIRSARSDRGVMRRLKVHLDRVSLCRVGAYPQAKVLVVRTKPTVTTTSAIEFDSDLAENLARLGIAVPDSLRGT